MSEPLWLNTISNHAVITRAELLVWLKVKVPELRLMIVDFGFPPPRFGSYRAVRGTKTTTATCRWRVGDVRAWLEGSRRLEKELATKIAAEATQSIRARQSLDYVMNSPTVPFTNSNPLPQHEPVRSVHRPDPSLQENS